MTSAKSIFISYRRQSSSDITGRIYDRLAGHFGENRVFKDVDSIPFGVNFRHHLEREVSHCPVLLAIIDPHWLDVRDEQGSPKLMRKSDWVRVEIATALRCDRLVIPVLVSGATLPEETVLPEDLKALAYRQSAVVRCDPDFHRDMDRLIGRIEGVFGGLGGGAIAPESLIDELAAVLASAHQPTQASTANLGRRRWLRLVGLGTLGGGSALLLQRRGGFLGALANSQIGRAVPGLAGLQRRSLEPLEYLPKPPIAAVEPSVEELADQVGDIELPGGTSATVSDTLKEHLYAYQSVRVDGFGIRLSGGQFATRGYREIELKDLEGRQISLPLVSVVGGQFLLGAPGSEVGHDPSQPAQTIAAVESFWMGIYPVTQEQWRAVALMLAVNRPLEPEPAHFRGGGLPVEQVSWLEAMEFCDRLTQWLEAQHSSAGLGRIRLPTEAEWEYACRAGTTTPFHTGQTLTSGLANFDSTRPYRQEPGGEFRGTTTAVGSLGNANDFGLYDMHGNVLEWCSPRQDSQLGVSGAGAGEAEWRVVRGGSWQSPPQDCRSAYRAGFRGGTRSSQIGFRVVVEMHRA